MKKLLMIGLFLSLGVLIILGLGFHLSAQQDSLVQASAINSAELITKMIRRARTLYTTDVVKPAEEYGITVTHDDLLKKNAIPLPATFSMRLGEQLAKETGGVKSKLFSPNPFPWRESTGGIRNAFEQTAWEVLNKHSDSVYYEFQTINDKYLLRYASPDKMEQSCIQCHNSHKYSPKKDWEVGDVRGVLVVEIPLELLNKKAGDQLKSTFIVFIGTIIIMIFLGVIVVSFYFSKEHLLELSKTDPLTKLGNRRAYDTILSDKVAESKRSNLPLALIVLDVDDFKKYNDCYGHNTGDLVLISIAGAIKRSLPRATDVGIRYGGEEFVALLSATNKEGAQLVAERILTSIQKLSIEHKGLVEGAGITASIGVSVLKGKNLNENDLFNWADKALYRAKKQGKNRFEFYTDLEYEQ